MLLLWNDTLVIWTFRPFGHGILACRVMTLWRVVALWALWALECHHLRAALRAEYYLTEPGLMSDPCSRPKPKLVLMSET